MSRFFSVTAVVLLGLLLAGCQSEKAEVVSAKTLESDTPADAIERIAAELKADNLLGAMQAAMPKTEFEAAKAEYEKSRKETPSAEDRAEFETNMAKLTADDAEQALMAELEPLLAKYETEFAAQLPMFLAMGRTYANQWLQEDKTLSEDQKKQATQMIDAVAKWLESVNFADRKLAGQAIGRVVAAARALELKTLDDVQALEFEQAMAKASIVSSATKDVLALYGLKINDALASVDAEVLSTEGDAARVSVAYRMFDQPLEAEANMVRREGRWFGKDTLEKMERERAAAAAEAKSAGPSDSSDDFQDQDDLNAEAEAETADSSN